MKILERMKREPAREYALRNIKHNIVLLEIAPGSMVSENELAVKLGISRTPVREALLELSKVKIVDVLPQKGSYITKIDYDLVEEACFLRIVLEKAIVELVCDMATNEDIALLEENLYMQKFYLDNPSPDKLLEIDNEFHKQLFKICNKMQTYRLIENMMTHFDRVRDMSLHTVKDIKIIDDHHKIVDSIKIKDKQKCIEVMTKHLERYKIDREIIRSNYPQYFG